MLVVVLSWPTTVLHVASPRAAPRHLVAFRARSRHTYGFEPADRYDLPLLELLSLIDGVRFEAIDADLDGSSALFWADGAHEAALSAAARRGILVHGLWNIVASAPTVEGLRAGELDVSRADDVEVIDFAEPNLPREARDEMRALLPPPAQTSSGTATFRSPRTVPSSSRRRASSCPTRRRSSRRW